MGKPRITARFELADEAGAASTLVAFRGSLAGRQVRREHALNRSANFPEDRPVDAALLDVTLETLGDLDGLKVALIARANRPEVLAAEITWHDCGEDEPEPEHFGPPHRDSPPGVAEAWMRFQEWQSSRDCSRRGFERWVKAAPVKQQGGRGNV